ncbi:MAG: hypothetical protein IIB73_09925 [Proteobacteria bacterium]|nr:hypothetical protein [Pseudomonadota bacterium]
MENSQGFQSDLLFRRDNEKGVQAMLDIRSFYLNEHWDEFTLFRINKLNEELYPERTLVEHDWKIAV